MNRTARRSGLLLLMLGLALSVNAQAPAKHPLAFDDLIKLHRISSPEVSPDGKWVAYGVSTPDMEADRGVSNIWIVSTSGSDAIQLTQSGKDSAPTWSPDGKTLAFLSGRDGTSQVYVISMEGGEAKKLTTLSTGADLFKWSPDGKNIAFTSGVYVDCKDDACNKKRDEEKEKSKVKAHVADHLLYDADLLRIFASKISVVRLHNFKQLEHNRCDAAKMSRSRTAAELVAQTSDRDIGDGPRRIHLFHAGGENEVHTLLHE